MSAVSSLDAQNGGIGNTYQYSQLLSSGNIRLLRLLPDDDKTAPLQCQLFDYPMQELEDGPHMYEALSYVWGSSEKPHTICVGGNTMAITANLHEVLVRLRNRVVERILWIDAICIDQSNTVERGDQIRLMAEIYCKANRVIVWLGESADGSDQVLKSIRMAADEEVPKSSGNIDGQAILTILRRPWFRRIWVLQEIAAAQNIVVMCGPTRIDGYAFCLGLPSLLSYADIPDHIRSVTYLMRGSIFRPKYRINISGDVSLDIRPLGELIDMYHAHEATERHDKIFALLGMSSDNPATAGLVPNYKISWDELMAQVVKFILGEKVLIKTWAHLQAAVVSAKGIVVGSVTSVRSTEGSYRNNRQIVDIKTKDNVNLSWTVQSTAKPIQIGDICCHLFGAAKPMIIRPFTDHFSVIMTGFMPPDYDEAQGDQTSSSQHDFLLIWDWDASVEKASNGEYETWLSNRVHEEPERQSDKQTRLWNAVMIMSDAGSNKSFMIDILQEMKETYTRDFGEADPRTLACISKLSLAYGRAGHIWQAEMEFWCMIWARMDLQDGYQHVIKDLDSFGAMWKGHGQSYRATNLEKISDLLTSLGSFPLTANEVVEATRAIYPELAISLVRRRLRNNKRTRLAPTEAERASDMRRVNQRFARKSLDTENVEGLLMEAIEQGNVEATFLLLCQKGVEVAEDMLIKAIKKYDDSTAWCLLAREKDSLQITEKVVVAAAIKSSESVLQYLLERHRNKVLITEEVVIAAVQNKERSVLTYLLQKWGSEILITQRVAIAAARSEFFPALKILLHEKGSEMEITEDVVLAAAWNREKMVLVTLLIDRGDRLQITTAVLQAARRMDNTMALKWLLNKRKEERGRSVKD
ncbi:heterokaryon incompatibility domain-containing protein [Trichoderma austrokoningii]